MSYNKTTRPSPTDSATWYMPGTYKIGNDGYYYTIAINSAGIHRWVKTKSAFSIKEIKSINHPAYTQPSQPLQQPQFHKYNIGDVVEVVESGNGCSPTDIGQMVTITARGNYSSEPGYQVNPPIGNSLSRDYGGYIGERSFKLLTSIEQVKKNIKPLNMSKAKSISKRKAGETRSIETSLINKEEVFKMLALAESTGLPLLLIGEPGVAKTKSIIDYAKAWLNKDGKMNEQDFMNKIYILETDEGTKASEVKGMPNLETLFTHNRYELNTPIADAEIVIINEVDKASSAIRNAMLGVMNEKFLFNGKNKIPCKWKLFVATCNEIPKDEKDSPFWDRFMLKMTVNRVSVGEMSKYYSKGARNYREKFDIGIPTNAEIDQVEISTNKLDKYLEVGYGNSSDRTLTFVPRLARAVTYIWDISVDKALVKTAQIMINQSAGSELQNKLMSTEVKNVMSKVEMLHSYSTNEQLELAIAEIESMINTYTSRGSLDEGQVEEIEYSMNYIIENHPARKDYNSIEDLDSVLDSESSFS